MKETILQFGTGNFLRGFVDSFIDSMNKSGLYDGKIVIVSPTDSAAVDKINEQNGKYNLILRGIDNGKKINNITLIESVSRAVNPYKSFDEYLSLAENPDLKLIVSNTTEAGIAFDGTCRFDDKPAASFPAKLCQFLYRRFKANIDGLIILACELIDNNGSELKKCVLKYADLWNLEDSFKIWLNENNSFCNTLVDRIVTGYPKEEADALIKEIGFDDKLLDTAEPYHLWVIEGNFEEELPLKKAGFNVIWTDDVKPFKKMKVRILNGAHTSLVFPSLLCGIDTVRESLEDTQMKKFLDICLNDYILPILGSSEETDSFAKAVLERFSNPFIRHLWLSISLNSVSKYTARVLPTVIDYIDKTKNIPMPLVFSLACLIEYYKTNDISDSPSAVEKIKTSSVYDILSDSSLWGEDISFLCDFVSECLEKIHNDGIRESLKWIMS